jgi:hypothetical protein
MIAIATAPALLDEMRKKAPPFDFSPLHAAPATPLLLALRTHRVWSVTLRTAYGELVEGHGADFDSALAAAERKGGVL